MAHFEFKLPDIGEGVAEGEVVAWHVQCGDVVVEDQPLVDVMTDKATVAIGSPRAGSIKSLCVEAGQTARVGQVLVVIALGADDHAATAVGDLKHQLPGVMELLAHPPRIDEAPEPSSPAPTSTRGSASDAARPSFGALASSKSRAHAGAQPVPATPATRRLARSLDVALSDVQASGSQGRVTSEDVRQYAASVQAGAPGSFQSETSGTQRYPQAGPTLRNGHTQAGLHTKAKPQAQAVANGNPVRGEATRAEARRGAATQMDHMAHGGSVPHGPTLGSSVPFRGVRKAIAERMQQARDTAVHFTFVEECDVSALVRVRALLAPAAARAGLKLNYLPFIAKAVAMSLARHPVLNGRLDEDAREIVIAPHVHLGIAVATPQGVMVPVLRHANQRSLLDLATDIDRLSEGARQGTLRREELSGSTFTITSLGRRGGLLATPILNHPEVGILGVHRMKERPVVRDGNIVVGQVMCLSLSFDHRVVDGDDGASFAYEIIDLLETPEQLLLGA